MYWELDAKDFRIKYSVMLKNKSLYYSLFGPNTAAVLLVDKTLRKLFNHNDSGGSLRWYYYDR